MIYCMRHLPLCTASSSCCCRCCRRCRCSCCCGLSWQQGGLEGEVRCGGSAYRRGLRRATPSDHHQQWRVRGSWRHGSAVRRVLVARPGLTSCHAAPTPATDWLDLHHWTTTTTMSVTTETARCDDDDDDDEDAGSASRTSGMTLSCSSSSNGDVQVLTHSIASRQKPHW